GGSSEQATNNEFSILPNVFLVTPTEGTVGRVITVSGNGYGGSESIKINFGVTSSIVFITSASQGSFTVTFTINTQPYGLTTIIAHQDNIGLKAYGTFAIESNIILISPKQGTVGTIITVRGNGFIASHAIKLDFGIMRTIQTTSTYAHGSFTTTFTIDTQPYGITTIKAYGSEEAYGT
ncbi:MAG: hypothetical protein QME49_10205, partial [bacterium]|nr:hypothetical protein [bacterium]